MGEAQLKAIKIFTGQAVTVNRYAMQKRIPMIRLNYSQITGRLLNEIQFQREAGMTDDSKDRKNKYQNFLEQWFSVSFADRRRGEFYVEDFAAVVAWRNSVDELFRVRRDFLVVHKETTNLQTEALHAFILGKQGEAKYLLAQIRLNTQEMIDIVSGRAFEGVIL